MATFARKRWSDENQLLWKPLLCLVPKVFRCVNLPVESRSYLHIVEREPESTPGATPQTCWTASGSAANRRQRGNAATVAQADHRLCRAPDMGMSYFRPAKGVRESQLGHEGRIP